MANAQLNDIPLGMATPSRESGALDSEDHRVIDENVSFTAVAVETDKVVESLGSSHKARRNISSRQDDEMSLVDGTEEDVRQSWSDLDTRNPKRKRDDSVPSRKGKIKHRKVVNHSSSSSENTSSSESSSSNSESESSEDNEAFDPEPSLSKDKNEKVPSHVTKYIEKYALKGISKKTRQDMSLNWPIPSSKGLKALETDRFFKKNYFQGRKWNARLERSKINTQLRILDVMGPLSRFRSEAHRIKIDNQGMDPSDVIQLTQRAIVLAGNAHYVYNTDRRKAMLVKTMPDSLDFLNEKKGKKALAKSKGQLFGNKFLKSLAKENKDNKELREMLLFSNKKKHAGKPHFNRKNDQFFQQGPTNNLQSVGGRQALHPQVSGKRPWQGNQSQNRQGNSYGQRQNQRQNQTQNHIQLRSTKKPFKGLSSQTVGNWIKWVMKEAGIDISLFQAHSFRMVSTSKAAMSGISMDDIMSMADWSNTRTFNKFYFRTNEKAGFADKVLEMKG